MPEKYVSIECTLGNHDRCFSAQGRCTCSCHGGGSGVREPRRPLGNPPLKELALAGAIS